MINIVPFLEPCPGCDGFVEIETSSDFLVSDPNHANVGDRFSCTLCQCKGVIIQGKEGKIALWDELLCKTCHDRFEWQITLLANRIVNSLKGTSHPAIFKEF